MFKLQGWVEEGNTVVNTGGLGSSNVVQGSFPGATVTVYVHGSNPATLATLYSDDNPSPTPLANPFTANLDGTWGFYADSGRYDVVFSGGTLSAPFTIEDLTNGAGGGTGDVSGPGSAVDGDVALWDGTSGKLLKDGLKVGADLITNANSVTAGNIAIFRSRTIIYDSGVSPASLVRGPSGAVNNNLAVWDGVSGKLLKDGGTPSAGGFLQFSQVNLTGGNFSTNNITATDVTGATLTITTGAHRCIVNLVIAGKSASANEYVKIFLNIDGSIVPSSTAYLTWIHGTDSSCNLQFWTDVLSAGSHTFKIQIAGTNGGVLSTVYAQTANPLILQVIETSLTT